MLAPPNRLRHSTDFSSVVRRGVRVGGRRIVVHHLDRDRGPSSDSPSGAVNGCAGSGPAPRVGLVVSRAVGGSVVRHRVSRRLRAQLAARVGELGAGSRTVVRALPAAATASSVELGADLDRALARLGRG